MKRWVNTKNNLPAISFIIILIILWEIIVRIFKIKEFIIPAPSAIGRALFDNLPLLLSHTKTTLYAALVGLMLAIVIALFLAVIMDRYKLIKSMIYPVLVISQTVPIIALAPIIMIWFGLGILPKILIVALVCFFPIAINLVDGLENVEQERIELLKVMGAGNLMIFKTVQLPSVLPYFFSGLKISTTYSVMGAVIGEWLGASSGLGIYMTRAMQSFNTAGLFAAILLVVLLSICLFKLVELIAWIMMPWNRLG